MADVTHQEKRLFKRKAFFSFSEAIELLELDTISLKMEIVVYHIRDVVANSNLPPSGLFGRIKDAWQVLQKRAYAIELPSYNELQSITTCETETNVLHRAHILGMHSDHPNMDCDYCYHDMIVKYLDLCEVIMTGTKFEKCIPDLKTHSHQTMDENDNWTIFNLHPVYFIAKFLEIQSKDDLIPLFVRSALAEEPWKKITNR